MYNNGGSEKTKTHLIQKKKEKKKEKKRKKKPSPFSHAPTPRNLKIVQPSKLQKLDKQPSLYREILD